MIESEFGAVFRGLRNVHRVNDYMDSETEKAFACNKLIEKSVDEWNALELKQTNTRVKQPSVTMHLWARVRASFVGLCCMLSIRGWQPLESSKIRAQISQ